MLTLLLVLTLLAIIAWLFRLSRGGWHTPGLHLGPTMGVELLIGSLVFGSLLYVLLALLLYNRLVEHVMHRAVPPDMRAWVALTAQAGDETAWPAEAAQWLLESRELTGTPADATARLEQSLACPGNQCASYPVPALRSAVETVASLTVHSVSKTATAPDAVLQCVNDAECARNPERAIARLLVGSLGCEDKDMLALRDPNVSCLSLPTQLSAPWQPNSIATWMGLECQADAVDASNCEAATYLLQGALDDPGTRRHQIALGMVYGFGRWLVLVLALGVMAALCWRSRVRRSIERDLALVADAVSHGNGPSAASAMRVAQANDAWQRVQKASRTSTGAANAPAAAVSPPHPAVAQPDPLRVPVHSLLFQACRSHNLQDATPVRDAAHQSRHEMDGWWELLTTVITVFPVIGLAATLNGLIHAFAQADQIAVAIGDARASAIRMMVAELSASFSTTFVALLLMSFLTLWTLRTRHAEQRAFTRAVENIDEALVYR